MVDMNSISTEKIPDVSVVMPVFNGAEYIREAIESLLGQTMTNFELIVVNDGSTDDSAAIVASYNDPRIRLIDRAVNLGLTITRNEGVSAARGEFIAMLDCDDVALPARLEKQLAYMQHHPECGLLGSWFYLIDQNGQVEREQRVVFESAQIPVNLLFHNVFGQSTVMLRRSLLPEGPYREEFPPAEDYDLWVRLADRHSVANLPETLVKYRIHPGGVSWKKAETAEKSVKKILRSQLENLGLVVSDADMETHRCIGRHESATLRDDFEKVDQWFLRISVANKKTKIYSQAELDRFLAAKWYRFCLCSSNFGLTCFKSYLRGKTRRLNPSALRETVTLLRACMHGHR